MEFAADYITVLWHMRYVLGFIGIASLVAYSLTRGTG